MTCQISRRLHRDNYDQLVGLVSQAFGGLEYLPRVRNDLSQMDPAQNGLFIAEEHGSITGCTLVWSLPRKGWFDIRHLALRDGFSGLETGEQLIQKSIAYAEDKSCEYLKTTTPSVQPYVDLYKKFAFTPVRRSLRMTWDLDRPFGKPGSRVKIRQLSITDQGSVEKMIMNAHLPYWDWWLEEQGGKTVHDWATRFGSPAGTWLGAIRNEELSGLSGFAPDAYGTGEARLTCFCVLPEHREQEIGSTLLSDTLSRAKQAGQRRLVVYTLGYLDSLPPGAVTYLKSGAKIEAEYLQLQRK